MKELIDDARAKGESLGGEFVVIAEGLVPGLGSYASGPARLTSRLGAAAFSIPAIKGVEFGLGFEAARRRAVSCMIPSTTTERVALPGLATTPAASKAA